jgi:hypothetical protein
MGVNIDRHKHTGSFVCREFSLVCQEFLLETLMYSKVWYMTAFTTGSWKENSIWNSFSRRKAFFPTISNSIPFLAKYISCHQIDTPFTFYVDSLNAREAWIPLSLLLLWIIIIFSYTLHESCHTITISYNSVVEYNAVCKNTEHSWFLTGMDYNSWPNVRRFSSNFARIMT